MNNQRRKEIGVVIKKLARAMQGDEEYSLSDIAQDIELIQNDEENYRDDIPENMQGGVRYEASDEACDNLSYACDCLNEAMDCEDIILYLKKAIEYLNDASA